MRVGGMFPKSLCGLVESVAKESSVATDEILPGTAKSLQQPKPAEFDAVDLIPEACSVLKV